MATIADKILEALAASGPLDDDVLAARFGVIRQSINQVARRLESDGKIRRFAGSAGKIVNALPGTAATKEAPALHSSPLAPSSPSEVITEDDVKAAVRDHLKAHGYQVKVAWGRTRGIDIDAQRPGHRIVLEAKGQVPVAGAQQVNYFLGALGELLQRMNDPAAAYGLALPDHRQYRGLVHRLPKLARERLGLTVYFVSRDGNGFAVKEDME